MRKYVTFTQNLSYEESFTYLNYVFLKVCLFCFACHDNIVHIVI